MRRLLLCPPDHYGIEYEINPWMSRARGADTPLRPRRSGKDCSRNSPVSTARSIWSRRSRNCPTWSSPPTPDSPSDGILSRVIFGTRNGPAKRRYFARWMEEHGYEIVWLPENLISKGKATRSLRGDALFCGYKFRTDINSHRAVADILGCLVISVELVDPRFYHHRYLFLSAAGWRRGLVSGGV